MKKAKRYDQATIQKVLEASKKGMKVNDIVKEYGVSKQTYFKWKRKSKGNKVAAKTTSSGNYEITKLKQIIAEQHLTILELQGKL